MIEELLLLWQIVLTFFFIWLLFSSSNSQLWTILSNLFQIDGLKLFTKLSRLLPNKIGVSQLISNLSSKFFRTSVVLFFFINIFEYWYWCYFVNLLSISTELASFRTIFSTCSSSWYIKWYIIVFIHTNISNSIWNGHLFCLKWFHSHPNWPLLLK